MPILKVFDPTFFHQRIIWLVPTNIKNMKFSKYLPYLGLIALILFLITDTSTFINDIPLNTGKILQAK